MEKNKINVAVFVSGGGTNLQALIDSKKIQSAKLMLVISDNKDCFALTRAKKAGLATASLSKSDYESPKAWENAILGVLSKHKIDVIVLAGFLSILSKDFIRNYERKIINIHPSLIPSFCGKGCYGLKVHEAALKRGVKISGATVHFVNEIPDGGEIIIQKPVMVEYGDTAESLQKRVMEEAEWNILPEALELVCNNLLKEQANE